MMNNEHTYVFDDPAKTMEELNRIQVQSGLINRGIGDLFPPSVDISNIKEILDIGSGTGNWAIEVAQAFPSILVHGIDLSLPMVEFCNIQVQLRQVRNATFLQMNALSLPLSFPDASFDLVNMRLAASFVQPAFWPVLLQECKRLLRPSGILSVVEAEIGSTTSKSYGTIFFWLAQALEAKGLGFGGGYSIGVIAVLNNLFREAGYNDIQSYPYFIETSHGTEFYAASFDSFINFALQMKSLVLKYLSISEDIFESTVQQALEDLKSPSFCGCGLYLNVLGKKVG